MLDEANLISNCTIFRTKSYEIQYRYMRWCHIDLIFFFSDIAMDQFVKMNENTNEQEEQQATSTQSSGVKIVSRAGKELVVEV